MIPTHIARVSLETPFAIVKVVKLGSSIYTKNFQTPDEIQPATFVTSISDITLCRSSSRAKAIEKSRPNLILRIFKVSVLFEVFLEVFYYEKHI